MKCMAAALAVAVLAGCAARIPAPIESQLSIPESWRGQPPDKAEPVSHHGVRPPGGTRALLEKAWWKTYGDPALSELVARVLAHNTDVRLAQLRVAEFRARLAAADANRAPTLGATLTPVRTRTLAYNGVPYTTNLFAGEFQAAYEVDLWGRLAHASEAAAQSLAAEDPSQVHRLLDSAFVAAGLRG